MRSTSPPARTRTVVRTVLLLAATLAGLLAIPAGPAAAAPYANCTNLIDSTYNWKQSSCIWNANGVMQGTTGMSFSPSFNRGNVKTCRAILQLWDNTNDLYITYHAFDCTAAAKRGDTSWVPETPHVWLVSTTTHYRQYAYMIVETYTSTYNSNQTTCALRYFPEGTGQAGC